MTAVENNLSKTPLPNERHERARCIRRCQIALEGRRRLRLPRIHVLFPKRGAGHVWPC